MNRIQRLKSNLHQNSKKPVMDSLSWLKFDKDFFDEDVNEYRKMLRKLLEEDIGPKLLDYVEKAEYPLKIAQKLKK